MKNPGKKITIKDVAEYAGVSPTTVSHALNNYADVNEKTRAHIIEIAEELNYTPNANAKALGGMPKPMMALFLCGERDETDESGMIYGLLSGVQTIAQELDYDFALLTAPGKWQQEQNFNQLCRQKMVTGAVVFGLAEDDPYFTQIAESRIPCVLVDVEIPGPLKCTVTIDNVHAAYEEMSHLLEQGYRHIAVLNGRPEAQVCKKRMEGYLQSLHEHNLSLPNEWNIYTNYSMEVSKKEAASLKGQYPEIDAFVCASDAVAYSAVRAMEEMGCSVPEGVGIVGFDDFPTAKYFHGGITTVTQHPYDMGKAAANALAKLIQGEKVLERIELPYVFQKRHSTDKRQLVE